MGGLEVGCSKPSRPGRLGVLARVVAMDQADPASDWLRDRLSDGKCLKIAILSFSTGKIFAVLLFYSSFYGAEGMGRQMNGLLPRLSSIICKMYVGSSLMMAAAKGVVSPCPKNYRLQYTQNLLQICLTEGKIGGNT